MNLPAALKVIESFPKTMRVTPWRLGRVLTALCSEPVAKSTTTVADSTASAVDTAKGTSDPPLGAPKSTDRGHTKPFKGTFQALAASLDVELWKAMDIARYARLHPGHPDLEPDRSAQPEGRGDPSQSSGLTAEFMLLVLEGIKHITWFGSYRPYDLANRLDVAIDKLREGK